MDNFTLIKLLEKSIYLSKGTKLYKITRNPRRLFYSKILEFFSIILKNCFEIKAKTFWGEQIIVVIPEQVSLNLYYYGFYEEGLTNMILEYLKPGMTFIDIGAHIGYFSLLGSLIVGSEGKVHSFEPTPSTFNILRSNLYAKKNVELKNMAVYSNNTNLYIHDYGIRYSAFNSLYSSRLPSEAISKLNPIKIDVQAISLDEYIIANNIIPDFIKIDAESSEYQILIGMEKTLNKYSPIISIEVGDMDVKGVPTSKDLINFLVNKSYQPYEFKDGKILKHALKKNQYPYDNILFLAE